MKFDVITVGTATRDVFLKSDLFKILRDPKHLEKIGFESGEAECFALGGKIEIEKPALTLGGGAANAAVTFARQGFRTAALIKIGRDQTGAAVIRHLDEERIKSFALYDSAIGTSYSTILLSPEGERTILNYRGASETMRRREIKLNKLKSHAAYIVPGHIPLETVRSVIEHFRKSDSLIALNPSQFYVDLGLKRIKRLLMSTDVLILNREEAADLTGESRARLGNMFKKLGTACRGLIAITDGARGAAIKAGGKIFSAGIYKEKKIMDRTGAGDAFGSGLIAALAKGHGSWESGGRKFKEEEIKQAIRLGAANATSVVEHIGAQEGILKIAQKRDKRWKKLKIIIKPSP